MGRKGKIMRNRTAAYKAIVGFFDQQVLASYRNEADKYTLKADHFEGRLEKTDGNQSSDRLDIRFGYRTRTNGDLTLAVYLPDLLAASPTHQARWSGFYLEEADLTNAPDPRFEMWTARYLEGSWEVDNGPLYHIEDTIEVINALCNEVVGKPLFKFSANPILNFPAAQNTHAYQDAHKELYGYVIDGLNKDTITLIGARGGQTLNLNSDKTVAALIKVIPVLQDSTLQHALNTVSNQRRLAGHGVRPAAQSFQAFEQFTTDLEGLVQGLRELLAALETVLGMNGEVARKRQDAKASLPRIDQPPEPHYSITQLPTIKGKTVERVEFGFRQPIEGVHQSEAIILHFTDGSSLGIDTGSNAANIASEYEGLRAEDFHVDFMLRWVPPPQ
jgi:hypothetical protein